MHQRGDRRVVGFQAHEREVASQRCGLDLVDAFLVHGHGDAAVAFLGEGHVVLDGGACHLVWDGFCGEFDSGYMGCFF